MTEQDIHIANRCVIGDRWFQKWVSNKITRYNWDGKNSITAHTIIANNFKTFIRDIKIMPGINFECDHTLLLRDSKIIKRKSESNSKIR
jgi:hypothetical protein